LHETGINDASVHGAGNMPVDSSFEKISTSGDIMATWRRALEVAMTEWDVTWFYKRADAAR
jgi:hypothetical protein